MQVAIAFYRTREMDEAHAIVGRENASVTDLGEAVELALRLARNLPMPQQPDGFMISDEEGALLHSQIIGP